ncbi:phosphatidylglycerophosphatase A [Malaciobacter molluscorum LMG 25693]|uniref:Phosphatidylglycerophosphatase A n=1 Tax=Malaciobacter molluscorum LMG 25693 TaxID=870501 RepID=A0A2G1DEQ4_9BACT|nr:phosphatidylglycerophosphatase A [Malaciobacter molluscorum]AXX91182.1 phosphatidylglycerophosphatase A [Malaciobacter molluscorum LMG 25693]PHO16920.1 phosphatidylglycerophosphatase A [Malaciobacter molluscorum LMG 25693]RXJ92037.1 phosphatidylglycerophosphatase A [Malaciobacter molluscorum]
MRKFFLTVCYSGLSPKAPGTAGSFLSLLFAIALLQVIHESTLFLLALLITVIAVKQIDKYEEEVKEHDSKEIVIDELAGMWIALSICGVTSENIYYLAPLAFIYFRLFDIWKPSIIGRIDRNVKGGWGVMGDDLVAGIAGGIAAAGTYALIERFILPMI